MTDPRNMMTDDAQAAVNTLVKGIGDAMSAMRLRISHLEEQGKSQDERLQQQAARLAHAEKIMDNDHAQVSGRVLSLEEQNREQAERIMELEAQADDVLEDNLDGRITELELGSAADPILSNFNDPKHAVRPDYKQMVASALKGLEDHERVIRTETEGHPQFEDWLEDGYRDALEDQFEDALDHWTYPYAESPREPPSRPWDPWGCEN